MAGRPSRSQVYERLDEAFTELRERMGNASHRWSRWELKMPAAAATLPPTMDHKRCRFLVGTQAKVSSQRGATGPSKHAFASRTIASESAILWIRGTSDVQPTCHVTAHHTPTELYLGARTGLSSPRLGIGAPAAGAGVLDQLRQRGFVLPAVCVRPPAFGPLGCWSRWILESSKVKSTAKGFSSRRARP